MNNLSEEGQLIYQQYIDAKRKWIQYCKYTVMHELTEYCMKHKRVYPVGVCFKGVSASANAVTVSDLAIVRSLYKKLAVCCHPDKGGSNICFNIVNNLYINNDIQNLQHINDNLEEFKKYPDKYINRMDVDDDFLESSAYMWYSTRLDTYLSQCILTKDEILDMMKYSCYVYSYYKDYPEFKGLMELRKSHKYCSCLKLHEQHLEESS